MNPLRPTPDSPAVNPGYLRLLASVLRGRGFAVDALLAAAGLGDEAALAARVQPCSLRELDALVAAATHAGAGPELGLQVGQALRVSTHGPLGYAVASSPCLREALRAVQRYGTMRNATLSYRVQSTPTGADLALVERIDLGPTRSFYLAAMCLVLLQMVEAVVGPRVEQVRVDLPLPRRPGGPGWPRCSAARCATRPRGWCCTSMRRCWTPPA